MAKYSNLAKGTQVRTVHEFPLPGGGVDRVAVVPLLGIAIADVAKAAREFAVSRGAAAVDGDKEYELGIHVETIARAVLDVDSPADKPAPYFAGGVAEILDPATGLDPDRIALLFELQRAAQEAYSPDGGALTAVEFFDHLRRFGEADEGTDIPFAHGPRAKRNAFVRGTARLALLSLQVRSTPSPTTPDKAPTSESSASLSTPPVETPPAQEAGSS